MVKYIKYIIMAILLYLSGSIIRSSKDKEQEKENELETIKKINSIDANISDKELDNHNKKYIKD